jgi:hypothetical protein
MNKAAKGMTFEELNSKVSRSFKILFFKEGKLLKVSEAAFTPGKSYVTVIKDGKLLIGEDYRNSIGGLSETHRMLMKDAGALDDLAYDDLGGALLINEDGSIIVSGQHKKNPSEKAMRAIAKKLREIFPDADIKTTPGRLKEYQKIEH